MSNASVTLTIVPTGGDDHPVPAIDFIRQIEALKALIALTSQDDERKEVDILSITMNSPVTVEMGGFGYPTQQLFSSMFRVFRGESAPLGYDRQAFDLFRDLVTPIGRGIKEVFLAAGSDSVGIDITNSKCINDVMGQDSVIDGSIDGLVEAVNIHAKQNRFALYPVTGPTRIACFFRDDLLSLVRGSLGKYVYVQGDLKFRWREKFPYEVSVNKITLAEEDQPSLMDIIGMEPNATGGVPAETFVRSNRLGWN